MTTRGNAARVPYEDDRRRDTDFHTDELRELNRRASRARGVTEPGGRDAATEQRARLRLAPPAPVAAPRAPFVLLIVLLVVGGTIGILLLNTKINENAFTVGDLKENQKQLDIRQQQLEQEIAANEAPGNLAANARKLGLVPAGAPAFIRLPDGRIIGVPQPASGEPAVTSQDGTTGTAGNAG